MSDFSNLVPTSFPSGSAQQAGLSAGPAMGDVNDNMGGVVRPPLTVEEARAVMSLFDTVIDCNARLLGILDEHRRAQLECSVADRLAMIDAYLNGDRA